MKIRTLTVAAMTLLTGTTFAIATAFAANPPTKDAAIAMVKSAVAEIKTVGAEKAYAEINTPQGKFVDGEIYIIVQNFDGVTLAHATNPRLIGKNMSDVQDVDGKYFSRDMTELARKQASFWYEFKFANPVTKKIQVKDNYCEALESTRVCAGVYQP